jgi:DNA-binding PadR family transcriptional regulator
MLRDKRMEKDVVRMLRALTKGIMRLTTLFTLLEGPRYGYEILKELTKRTAGLWRPSPGSLYPILKSLAERRYVISEEVRHGAKVRRTYSLTIRGRAFITLLVRKLLEGAAKGVELDAFDTYLATHLEALKEMDPEIANMAVEYLRRKAERLQLLLRSIEEASMGV